MPQNLIEKITQQHVENLKQGQRLQSGDFVNIAPAHILTHDNTSAVMKKFKSLGCKTVKNNRQPVFALDHNIQDKGKSTRAKYAAIKAFGSEAGIDFYPSGRGIGHQIMCEEGYAWPGSLVVASDSHANMYGGLGVLGTPLVRSDAAAIWATGNIWWQIPPVARVELRGELRAGASGKDVILALAGLFNHDEVLNHAIEFTGDGVSTLSIDQRLTIANMTTEWGALAGVFPIDGQTFRWLESRAVEIEKRGLEGVPSDEDGKEGKHPRLHIDRIAALKHDYPYADPDANYAIELEINLESIEPLIAGPDHVKKVSPVQEARGDRIEIQKAYLLSCVNSRVVDLADAAQVLQGKRVADGVDLYVAAASSEVQAESERRGDWQTLLDAGAKVLPPGCGPCIGLGEGLLEDGDVAVSATNRNFKGRMGSREAQVYLASPAVVAASALSGYLKAPGEFSGVNPSGSVIRKAQTAEPSQAVGLIDGFQNKLEGRIIYCHQDNLNTDGIFPSKYTYDDNISAERMAEVVMENYDQEFVGVIQDGDILVGGYNFGTGSSREQAATALIHAGVRLVIAGSFSETYRRNAINNGLMVLESPDLVNSLVDGLGRDKLTVDTQTLAKLDFRDANIRFKGETYQFYPIGAAAQEILLVGGLENWVKEKL